MKRYWVGVSAVVVVMLGGCGSQELVQTVGAGATSGSGAESAGEVSDVSDCAADYPTFETVEAAAAESVLVLHGQVTRSEVDDQVDGVPPGSLYWNVDTASGWQGDERVDLGRIDVVGGELIVGRDPCGPLLVEGRPSFVFLSNAASDEKTVFYPVAVLTDNGEGVYVDSDSRIKKSDYQEIESAIQNSGLTSISN